jgi:hypothetical protein
MTTYLKSFTRLASAAGLAVAMLAGGARAGTAGWLDDVVRRAVRGADAGAPRATGRLLANEADEGLAALARRSDEVARLGARADAPGEAALRMRFDRVARPDAEMLKTFDALAPAERRLVVEMSEAAQAVARRYPGRAEEMIGKLGVEGLSAVRAYGDDVAEVVVKEGPRSIDVLRKTGRGGWRFFTEQVLPNKGKLAAAGVLALFLANPDQFVDSAGRATQYAVEQFAKAGVQLIGAAGDGAARGLDRALGGALRQVGLDHPMLRGLLVALTMLVALGALLVVLGMPARMLLRPFTWPLRLLHRPRSKAA